MGQIETTADVEPRVTWLTWVNKLYGFSIHTGNLLSVCLPPDSCVC
jgi:hypothetical protein